jgi:hypothetical protein
MCSYLQLKGSHLRALIYTAFLWPKHGRNTREVILAWICHCCWHEYKGSLRHIILFGMNMSLLLFGALRIQGRCHWALKFKRVKLGMCQVIRSKRGLNLSGTSKFNFFLGNSITIQEHWRVQDCHTRFLNQLRFFVLFGRTCPHH